MTAATKSRRPASGRCSTISTRRPEASGNFDGSRNWFEQVKNQSLSPDTLQMQLDVAENKVELRSNVNAP
jgi:hypothetical protein